MSYPILYSPTETEFDHNGLGILSDCAFCEVTEEANGIFELHMKYPTGGIHYSEIVDRAIISARADQFREPQLFRIYSISKDMTPNANILAQHISYDLTGIPVQPFEAHNPISALTGLQSNAVVDCPFTFYSDKSTRAYFHVDVPSSIRSNLGGQEGSILDVYGGEYEFDNYTVKLYNNRGMNRGVSIRYGKNLTDVKQEQNCANVATGIYPYWLVENEYGKVLIELPEKVVHAPGDYGFTKILTVDFSQDFEVQPTVEELREKAEKYIEKNKIGVPDVSLTVSFAQLEQTEEYKNLKLLERVSLFDTVNVEFPALKVSATAKAVKLVYDVLRDRVKSVSLGSVRANIADTIAKQKQEIEKKPSKSFMELAIEGLTKSILGAKGGSVRFLDTNGDGDPDTLYIADDPDPAMAVKVWRFNYEGWGASQNGYVGPFEMGASFNSGIVGQAGAFGTIDSSIINVINLTAESILSKTLEGILLKAGRIESSNGKIIIDLSNTEEQPIFNTGIKTNGLTVRNEDKPNLDLFHVEATKNYGHETFNMEGRTSNGNLLLRISELFSISGPDGIEFTMQDQENTCGINFSMYDGVPQINLLVNGQVKSTISASENEVRLSLPGIVGALPLYFQPNNDGTYTLMGGTPSEY